MLLMGLEEEYQQAMNTVLKADFSKSEVVASLSLNESWSLNHILQPPFLPYFETIIRYLGGLLSAYALRKDRNLLDRGEDLVGRVDSIFNEQTGLPYYSVNPQT